MNLENELRVVIGDKRYRLVPEETGQVETAVKATPVAETATKARPRKLAEMMTKSAPTYPGEEALLEACRAVVRSANGDKAMYTRVKDTVAMYTPSGSGTVADVPPEKREALIQDLQILKNQ